jgi:uncharacterized membrane protein SpoIIM required for sporulation
MIREVVYIKQNVGRWKEFEHLLANQKSASSDALADAYIAITDDLSYARTFYPKSQTTTYLNQLAVQTHQLIYINRKEEGNRVVLFWKFEFPLLMRRQRKYVGFSALIFFVAVFFGVISTSLDVRFPRLVLGDSYVNMTEEFIEQNDPMAVYKKANNVDMFLGISLNNLKVMFNAYVAGVVFSIGTAIILFFNGVMLGCFQYFFYLHGVLYESILSIWIHGTIEIFCIILSGAAGLMIGNSILMPSTYTRIESFRRGAKDGLKMAVGMLPFIVFAAFLEGFVTRYTQWPDVFRWAIILGSLGLIGFYFFWYPSRLWLQHQNIDSPKV